MGVGLQCRDTAGKENEGLEFTLSKAVPSAKLGAGMAPLNSF